MARCIRIPARTRHWVLTVLVAAAPTAAAAQSPATVRVEENFRRAPNDVVLARLGPGTPLTVLGRQDNWLEVEVRGWVWLNSLQASEDPDLDLVVATAGGENLRNEPQGTVLGRLEDGALLEELGREPGWAQVRRRGFIWAASVEQSPSSTSAAAPVPGSDPVPPSRPTASAPSSSQPGAAEPTTQPPAGFATATAAILTTPDGDTLAVTSGRGDLQIVAREGNWARVRLDGWVWMPVSGQAPEDAPPAALGPEDLTQAPQAHVGRVVSWRLQFISLEAAEELRTDFRRGEPFLLTRFGGPEGPFVYVAVPPEHETTVEGLVPLERISVTARVRTGASALTGTPIVDLLTLERTP